MRWNNLVMLTLVILGTFGFSQLAMADTIVINSDTTISSDLTLLSDVSVIDNSIVTIQDDATWNILDGLFIEHGSGVLIKDGADLNILKNISYPFVPDEVTVNFHLTATQPDIDQLIIDCETEIITTSNDTLDNLPTPLPSSLDDLMRNVYHLRITGSMNEADTIACFNASPGIVDVSDFNFIENPSNHQSDSYPNDPSFQDGSQWSLLNAGQPDPAPGGNIGTIDADIDVLQAWELPHTDCSNAIVAVLDNGADMDHPDLVGNLWVNPGEIAGNGIDDDNNGYIDDINGFDFTDDTVQAVTFDRLDGNTDGPEDTTTDNFKGHGTHVAGTIGAVGDNNLQITGVCQTAQLMIVRIGNSGMSTADFIDAVNYVVIQTQAPFNQNVKVVNLSYDLNHGGNFNHIGINNALASLNTANIMFVKAAGNSGINLDTLVQPQYPCNSVVKPSNAICVASSNNKDLRSNFSNYGVSSVHLGAPGENILSLDLNGGTKVLSGTSMAAPHVSGIAALAFSQFPTKTVSQVKTDILTGAVGPPASSGVDIVKTNCTPDCSLEDTTSSEGRLRYPYTGDLGDAPDSYDTIGSSGGALHWDIGNEFFGNDVTPEVDANLGPDQDGALNIVPVFDSDLADHPLVPGNGAFTFTPGPPWLALQDVTVDYSVCTDYSGIADNVGGRYQGNNADRTIYVNAWFDLNGDGAFTTDELLLEDIISPTPSPPPSDKSVNPNVSVNLQPILPAPVNAPVFPPPTTCYPVSSDFTVPDPGGNPDWMRFRVDFGEDKGANDPLPIFKKDGITPMSEHNGWSRHGEVEDFLSPKEIDFFPDSKAVVILNGPLGVDSVTMTGPTTVEVDLGWLMDSDLDGLEEVPTVMTQLDLTGVSTLYGTLALHISPTILSIGEIEEKVNDTPGVLDIPPFRPTGGANSFFDIYFEVDTALGTLHNKDPKHMESMIFHKPPKDSVYQAPQELPLYDAADMITAFSIGLTLHAPDPDETIDICVLVINGEYYPCDQFFIVVEEPGCPPDHWHSLLFDAYSIFLIPTPDPAPSACGFGEVTNVPQTVIPITQDQADAFFAMTGIMLNPVPPV